ncbi:ABC transporter permease [Mesorhizobium sp. Z1-4]|uniref:ABC transporter permease n=1 Tax=Mesorhizobium sp. Z1-4 TaxID=2448478 RepID=UPI00197E6E06|nr:ABC transporter permease [Mesorhizobium sp. Z1-4]
MRVELIKRPQQSALFSAISPFIALGMTLIAGSIMFSLLGKNPLDALYYYFIDPLTGIWDPFNRWQLHELAIKAAPLILIAVGLSVCFLSNNWNIGAEGQFVAGAMAGSAIPVLFPEFHSWTVLPLMLIMGMAGGAAYASIPAFLKVRFNTNEILTSLMLVYVAQLFNDWLVRGPWRNPEGFSFPGTVRFHEYAILPQIWPDAGRAHWGFIFALIAAVAVWFMLSKTVKGFEVKVLGQSPRAGRFAGFSASRMVFFAFLISGALAGLAGISEVAGPVEHLNEKISIGYGFTAIIVAFLGRLNPLGIVAAGLILALTYLGGEAAQISLQVSDKTVRAFQGMLLFFVLASDTLIHYRVRLVASPAAKPAKPAATEAAGNV